MDPFISAALPSWIFAQAQSLNVCHTVNGEHMTKIVNQGCVLNLELPYLLTFSLIQYLLNCTFIQIVTCDAFMCDEKYNDEW